MNAVGERLAVLDDRLRALQDGMARAVAEQAQSHAVLAQWMRDWTAEVTAWRASVDRRMDGVEGRQEALAREAEGVRGALRVALWMVGAATTLVTAVSSGVLVRWIGGALGGAP